jgi:hypothetical protein
MKWHPRRVLAALFLGLAALLPAGLAADKAKAAKPAPSFNIIKLGWLAGHWRQERAGRVTDEIWMASAGGVMLGMGRTVAKGKELEHEFLQIREGPGGELYFVAQPSGQTEATFKMVSLTDTEVIFENKEHDFPQTIGYSLGPDDTMVAYIEGPAPNGETKRVEFAYKRVNP